MKKVAILSVYDVYNYGSILQTYAMQQIVTGLNCENIIVRNDHRELFTQFKRCFNLPLLTMKFNFILRDFYVKNLNKDLGDYFASRHNAFDQFINDNLNISSDWGNKKNIAKNILEYGFDCALVGSDQVWNPMNIGKDFYTMTFIPRMVKRIAYAPSFGVSAIPKKQINVTREYLSQIDSLSVREVSGQKIVKSLIGKDIPVVADPTILLPFKEWKKFDVGNPFENEPYILCYFLGSNPSHRNFANRLKSRTGLKIISLPHSDEICKSDFGFGDFIPQGVGPKEFVNLIANAEYICTDSFHATVFSNLFNRMFFSFGRYTDVRSSASTNSRVPSLLNILGNSERYIDSSINVTDELLEPINYSIVNINIDKLRNNSKSYLLKALDL